jgi:hypothetical protein
MPYPPLQGRWDNWRRLEGSKEGAHPSTEFRHGPLDTKGKARFADFRNKEPMVQGARPVKWPDQGTHKLLTQRVAGGSGQSLTFVQPHASSPVVGTTQAVPIGCGAGVVPAA